MIQSVYRYVNPLNLAIIWLPEVYEYIPNLIPTEPMVVGIMAFPGYVVHIISKNSTRPSSITQSEAEPVVVDLNPIVNPEGLNFLWIINRSYLKSN